MSVREFTKRVGVADFGKADKQWFPAWLKRYAEFAQHDGRSVIPLTRELAVGFSRAEHQNLRDDSARVLARCRACCSPRSKKFEESWLPRSHRKGLELL
jgi:hypothetical protein